MQQHYSVIKYLALCLASILVKGIFGTILLNVVPLFAYKTLTVLMVIILSFGLLSPDIIESKYNIEKNIKYILGILSILVLMYYQIGSLNL